VKAAATGLAAWWGSRTIRFRLALWYAAGGTALFALFAFALYSYVAIRLARPLDHQLRQDLHVVEASLTLSPNRELLWNGTPLTRTETWMKNLPWFELWDENDNLVRRMWPFSGDRELSLPGPPRRWIGPEGQVSVLTVAPDLRLRTLIVPFESPQLPAHWMIRMIRIHQPYADALPDLRLIIFVTLPAVVALLVVGGYLLTRRWLLPLDRMAAEANRISADDLGRRLPVENAGDELGRLGGVFNVTLDRLQHSFEALDRFVADASHELRTPLTTLRSVGEVGLRKGRTVEEYREIIGSMLEEAQRLQRLVERLLELASAGGRQAPELSPVPLLEAARTCAADLGVLAEHRRQHISVEGEECTAATDPVLFRQALQNILENAIKYSPEDSAIRVRVRPGGGEAEVSVADEGPGIAEDDRERLSERFYRPDRARGRDSGGFGLGLSITKAYLRVLGGSLHHEPASPRGSVFRIRIPMA
jgi:signal transduction histidine kinase